MSIRRSSGWGCALLVALTLVSATAAAGSKSSSIVLEGAHSAEGIAIGRGATFYAGDLFAGDIYRGDLQRGSAALFIDAPEGRMATGMTFDNASGLLFVAGGFTGQAYVYDTATGATVATYQFADPADGPVINDVTIAGRKAYFTNSTQPVLYVVDVDGAGSEFDTLALTGPATELSGDFNLNGIAATANGKTLVVAHSANGALYTVNPSTGSSALIEGVAVSNVDGIVLRGNRLWAVQNFDNQISAVRLSPDLSSGEVEYTITDDSFEIPTTAGLHGNDLAVVNAKFDTGIPPTAETYDVSIVRS